MSINELEMKCQELRELQRLIEEAQAEAETIKDTISGTDWKVTYKAVTSARFDSTAFKKAMPDLAEAFTKTTTSKRFCIA